MLLDNSYSQHLNHLLHIILDLPHILYDCNKELYPNSPEMYKQDILRSTIKKVKTILPFTMFLINFLSP